MNYKIKIEFVLSLIPDKPDTLDVLQHKEVFWTASAQLAFWLSVNKDYTWIYKENNFPGLSYYNQFYFQGALGFFLTYDLRFKQTNLSFFKTFPSSLDISTY